MPRIKLKLPAKFSCPNATTNIPPEWGFKRGDYVKSMKYPTVEGYVCGADSCGDDIGEKIDQLIIYNVSYFDDGVNGAGTYTGYYEKWRKIEKPTM